MSLAQRYRVQSDPLRTERRVELAVLLVLALLLLQLLYSGSRLLLLSPPGAIAPAPDTLVVGTVQRSTSVEPQASREMQARPLFWDSRRPLEAVPQLPSAESTVAKTGKLKGVKLVGVFGSGNARGIIALVGDKKQRILLGEELDGWVLDAVATNTAVLTSRGRREELQLEHLKIAATRSDDAGAGTGSRGSESVDGAVKEVGGKKESAEDRTSELRRQMMAPRKIK